MTTESLLLKREDGVATIILNRPDRLNAINDEIRTEFPKLLAEVRDDDTLKVLVITGAGAGFCSGGDVGGFSQRLSVEGAKPRRETLKIVGSYLIPLARFEKPTIAAVNGVAAGGGLSLALICDFRIASEKARFVPAWVRIGLIPDDGSSMYLPRLVGLPKALAMMMTGDAVDANEAERIGLVNSVVPQEELMPKTMELARKLAKGPSIAIELMKKAAYFGIVDNLESHLAFESYCQSICRNTEDYKAAIKAFAEKKPPVFKGQ